MTKHIRKKIALFCKDQTTAKLLIARIEAEGRFAVTGFADKGHLLQSTASEFDLFLIESGPENVSGISMMEQIRGLPNFAPVILLNKYNQSRIDRTTAINAGAVDSLKLPVDDSLLLSLISAAIHDSNLQDSGVEDYELPKQFALKTADNEEVVNAIMEVPEQNPLIQFGISKNNRIELLRPTLDGNDVSTIETLRGSLLTDDGPLTTLRRRYDQNPNAPQTNLFSPRTTKYEHELRKPVDKINFTLLFALGTRIFAGRATSERMVASGEWPALDADESDAIDSLCDIHGPLIMATGIGRQLVADARDFKATDAEIKRDQNTLAELGQILSDSDDLFEPEASEALNVIAEAISDEAHPKRGIGLGIALASSATVIVVGGALLSTIGVELTTFAFGTTAVATVIGGRYMWEVAKKTQRFVDNSNKHAKAADDALDKVDNFVSGQKQHIAAKLHELAIQSQHLLKRISEMRPEFGWIKSALLEVPLQTDSLHLEADATVERMVVISDDPNFLSQALGLATNININIGVYESITDQFLDNFSLAKSLPAICVFEWKASIEGSTTALVNLLEPIIERNPATSFYIIAENIILPSHLDFLKLPKVSVYSKDTFLSVEFWRRKFGKA